MWPYIVVAFGIAVTGVTTYFYRGEIEKYFKGKNIVILGDSRVGKTTMHKFLREGEIVIKHIGTNRRETVKKNTFKLNGLKLKIAEGTDVPGQEGFEFEWKQNFVDSDICFYLFYSDKVFDNINETIIKVNKDLYHIGKWKEEARDGSRVIVIGTHMDKISTIGNYNKSNIQELHKNLRIKLVDGLRQGNIKSSEFFIGNLSNKEGLELIMSDILNYLSVK